MDLEIIINKFLEKTGYDKDSSILAIIFYGSRINKTNSDTSDLDVLLITKRKISCMIGMVIDNVKVDCHSYTLDTLYSIIYETKMASNEFFSSVLKNGMIIKNDDRLVETIKNYLDEISHEKIKKRHINSINSEELYCFYRNFLNYKDDYSYYNLLNIIRKNYHYIKRYSYVNSLKVGKIYKDKEKYENDYCLILPPDDFIKDYMSFIDEKDYYKRLKNIHTLLGYLNISIDEKNQVYYETHSTLFLTDLEIKRKLVTLYNKLNTVSSMLVNKDSYSLMAYNILLKEFNDFSVQLNRDILDLINLGKEDNDEIKKINILWECFKILEEGYHFDYDNYVLKL